MNFKKRVAAVIGLVIAAIAACAFVWKPPEEIVVVVRGVDYSQYVEWHGTLHTQLMSFAHRPVLSCSSRSNPSVCARSLDQTAA